MPKTTTHHPAAVRPAIIKPRSHHLYTWSPPRHSECSTRHLVSPSCSLWLNTLETLVRIPLTPGERARDQFLSFCFFDWCADTIASRICFFVLYTLYILHLHIIGTIFYFFVQFVLQCRVVFLNETNKLIEWRMNQCVMCEVQNDWGLFLQ